MIIQLTEYGLQLLTETKKPLSIKEYKLGSAYNYAPGPTTSDIKGSTVYSGQVTDYITLNANVVKYQISLDYNVGDFKFGEFGLYVNGRCVAIGVDTEETEKVKFLSRDIGNAIVIDIYLQMTDGNYIMWADALKPGDQVSVAVVQAVDYLPAISSSSPNMYIVAPVNVNQADTLAYTSNTGLWAFDNYQYENSHEFTITQCTTNSVVIDTRGIENDRLQQLSPAYVGQTIFEFISGKNVSICRTVATFVIGNGTSTFGFNVPLAAISSSGDRIRVYSRQKLSITDTVIPIATTSTLGGVIVGDGLEITYDGILSVDFPVTSVNGQYGDVVLSIDQIDGVADVAISNDYNDLDNKPDPYVLPIASNDVLGGVKIPDGDDFLISSTGTLTLAFDPVISVNGARPDHTGNVNVKFDEEISGLVVPMRLPEHTDLNNYNTSGLYYGSAEDANSWVNKPDFEFQQNVTLEVVPIGSGFEASDAVQRISTNGYIFLRIRSNGTWYEWQQFYSVGNLPIASTTQLGLMQVGDGLSVNRQGIVEANVKSVNGQTGDINFDNFDWASIFQVLYNKYGGVPQLSENEADPSRDDYDQESMKYGRISWRQLTYGGMYLAGNWNSTTNEVTDTSELEDAKKGLPRYQKLENGGKIRWLLPDSDPNQEDNYELFRAKGWVVRVTDTSNRVLDNESRWLTDDWALSTGSEWVRLYGKRSFLRSPVTRKTGIVVYRQEDSTSFIQNLASPTNTIAINQELIVTDTDTNDITLDLPNTGVVAGDYYHVTVDVYGRITSADNNIDGGTF